MLLQFIIALHLSQNTVNVILISETNLVHLSWITLDEIVQKLAPSVMHERELFKFGSPISIASDWILLNTGCIPLVNGNFVLQVTSTQIQRHCRHYWNGACTLLRDPFFRLLCASGNALCYILCNGNVLFVSKHLVNCVVVVFFITTLRKHHLCSVVHFIESVTKGPYDHQGFGKYLKRGQSCLLALI